MRMPSGWLALLPHGIADLGRGPQLLDLTAFNTLSVRPMAACRRAAARVPRGGVGMGTLAEEWRPVWKTTGSRPLRQPHCQAFGAHNTGLRQTRWPVWPSDGLPAAPGRVIPAAWRSAVHIPFLGVAFWVVCSVSPLPPCMATSAESAHARAANGEC